ncbi:MAG: hypothetical protein EOO96_29715 [Pedobacter sp.]|nr:MAG: hypothetical protein EOO96_29715 [Pedobacter sp.]
MDNIYLLIFYSVLFIFLLVTFFLVMYIRNQNMLWQQKRLFQETEILQQKELLSAVIESQEIERKRIGEDLHDEIGGTLSAIKLMLNAAKNQGALHHNTITEAKSLIDQMIVDVRNISHDLSPPGLAMFGLYVTIESFTELINNTKQIEIIISHQPFIEQRLLNEKAELALFRVITQLIANTLKHAHASKIEIAFKPNTQQLEIDYSDNGKGVDIAVLDNKKGIGMQNIYSRLQMINANFKIETRPNDGFKINIVCPIG